MINSLYTWVDVEMRLQEQRLAGKWPPGLVGVSAYYDGLVVRIQADNDREIVQKALIEWFGARYQPDKGIFLDALPEQERIFPVTLEVTGETKTETPLKLSFECVALLPEGPSAVEWPPPFENGSPAIFAFYSFKGGVGRTLHLLAFLKALSEQQPPISVLVVDADLEAPGITSLAKEPGFGQPAVSLLDFLALAHSDTSPRWSESVELTAHHLRTQPLRLSVGGKQIEQYLLPAFREDSQALHVDVKPEHLVQGPGARWHLAELFAALGRELQVGVVLIDLRAGFSELSSPLLFDPRLQRIIFSTPSVQSLEGTYLVLSQLRKLAPPLNREDLNDPVIILTFLTPEMSGSEHIKLLQEKLLGLYPDLDPNDEVNPPRLRIDETGFAQELLVISSLTDAIKRLDGTDVAKKAKELIEEWFPVSVAVKSESMPIPIPENRIALAEFAKSVEYAESGKGERFLTTTQLRALAQKFEEEPPNAIIMGAKGAGKTYTYLQLVRQKLWTRFVAHTLKKPGKNEWGYIWPLLQPKNLQDPAKQLIQTCLAETTQALGIAEGDWRQTQASDIIRENLQKPVEIQNESWWRNRWFDLIARSLGIAVNQPETADQFLVSMLREKRRRLIVIVDGLEEIFSDVTDKPIQQVALRALVQDVPSRLREIPNCPLGLLVFVRADVVRASIPQNIGQFERQYEPYTLRWDQEQTLRLAVWICQQAGLCLQLPEEKNDVETITFDEAAQILFPIWGRKLGSDNSKEARTAEWVIAALSDFHGQIQARDLVRLLRYAAESSQKMLPKTLPADRLLPPRAVRDAIKPCSEVKVDEIEQEIPALTQIFKKLREASERRIPFDAVKMSLDLREIQILAASGVVIESEGKYFMPEIFRLGLDFQLAQGARPRVLSLAKRAFSNRS